MRGGRGNDVYVVDNVGDQVIDVAYGGRDLVESAINFILPNLIEDLVLTGAATRGTGNAAANTITGTSSANTLNGAAGADILIGGDGDDVYVVDNANDQIIEAAGEGDDLVFSLISYTLSDNLEAAVLAGAAANGLTGNALANTLTGNAGANTLNGMGGADILTGGAGADLFVFGEAPGVDIDTVSDFFVGVDQLHLSAAAFAGLSAGPLDPLAFTIGAAASDPAHRLVYDSAVGALFWDDDGDGANAAVQFAALGAGLALTSADFLIV